MSTTPQSYGLDLNERINSPVSQWMKALAAHSKSTWSALPAIVVSFNAAKQTVVVQPAVNDVERIAGVLTTTPLPQLADVPVMLSGGGDFTITLPIQPGDECVVVFADMCIDSWFQAGGQQNQFEDRRHSLADGFAFFAARNQRRVLSNYSTSSVQLRNGAGTVVIDVAASQVTVTAPTVQVNASGTATVSGSTVNVTGSSQVNISGAGHTSIEGKDWLTHKHSGVQSGGSSSGPVI